MERHRLRPGDTRALAAVAGQFFVNGAMYGSFLARSPQIRDRIDVTVERFGLLLTGAASFGLLGSLLAGRIVHAAGTRRVLGAGAIVMVLSLPVIGWARGPEVWLLGLAAFAFADALVDISMNLQGSWISGRRRTGVMNRLHGVWSLGLLTGGLGAAGANAAGITTATHLAVVAVVTALVLVAVTRHLLADDGEGHGQGTSGAPTPSTAAKVSGPRPVAPVVLLCFAGMFAATAEVTGGDWASFRLTDDLGATAARGSLAFAAYTVGMTSMRFAGDALQHRWGRVVLHHASVATAVAGFVLASLVPVEAASMAGFLLVGVGVATFMPRLYDDAARLPGRRGAGLGAMTGGMRFALLVTPVAVGTLAGTGLSVGDAVAIVTLPAAVGLVIVTEWNDRLLSRRHGPPG